MNLRPPTQQTGVNPIELTGPRYSVTNLVKHYPVLGLFQFFFLREFFSHAPLSECLEQAIQCSVSLPRKRSKGFVTCSLAGKRDVPLRMSVWEANARWERTSFEERRINCKLNYNQQSRSEIAGGSPMEKALNLRLFANSCNHPQWRSGYVRSGQTEGTGFKSC